jgi:antirestriction protein ArdC
MPYISPHADYIKSWIQVLKNDHRAIFKAAHQAQKALDFITKAQFEDPIPAEAA